MTKRRAGISRERLHGADLIGHEIFEIARVHRDGPPAEPPKIVETWMRAKPNAKLLRANGEPVHDRGVARVKAAGHIGGGHDAQQLLVVPHFVGAEALAHIRVEIDLHRSSWTIIRLKHGTRRELRFPLSP